MSEVLYASREQLLEPNDSRGIGLRIPLGASLVFHLGLVGLMFFKQSNLNPPIVSPAKDALVVSISTINPQRKMPAIVPDLPAADNENAPQLLDEPPAEIIPQLGAGLNEDIAIVDSSIAQDSTAPQGLVHADGEPASEEPAVRNPGVPVIDTEAVRNSVTAYVTTYRSTLTSDWLAACQKYQNEHGVKSCPQGEEGKSQATMAIAAATQRMFDTTVSGASTNARISRQLMNEMDTMRPYLKDGSIMGELARQRYILAQANYCSINGGCRGPSVTTVGSFATAVSTEGSIAIMSFDPGGISLFGGLISLTFKDGLKTGNTAAKSATPFIPYRFTGVRPGQAAEETEFVLEAPLFPIRR